FTVEKVLVKKGAKVERGQPLWDDYCLQELKLNRLPPKDWVDKIHEERRILAENLPETIYVSRGVSEGATKDNETALYVRVYEDRVDLLTAVIIGPQGTPYQNGLFFFDVCFPSNLPVSPPLVHYRSGGLGINPNLYKCGKVHLNLPKTGSIGQEKLWAGNSTILQLLLSIQDRILNTNPLYNDITYSVMKGSVYGEQSSAF
ncbi:ubiquitin-conjugating enzyme/RWD-like protein, partial [Tanacetum coccineum]